MWKVPISVLCGALAALPLVGCVADAPTTRQADVTAPATLTDSIRYYDDAYRNPTASHAAPAAVLVFLPPIDVPGREAFLAQDPALWAAQGFAVVVPRPREIYQLVADQQAALARLVASAHALANAPLWLVGTSPAIEAAMPPLRDGVSGVVVTSLTSPMISCSESFSYYNPGGGVAPKVDVERSGDCNALSEAGTGRWHLTAPETPATRPNPPRIIEASAVPKNLPPAAQVRRLAELIKASRAS
jgi:hypothetical protein